MPRPRLAALLALLLLVVACQRPPDPARGASGSDPEAQAARALAAGRSADAANLYREGLKVAAVASSYLEHRDDAIREFRWALRYGPPGSAEVQAARQWLARAGALPTRAGRRRVSPGAGALPRKREPRGARRVRQGWSAGPADDEAAAVPRRAAEQPDAARTLQSADRRAGQLPVPRRGAGSLQAHEPRGRPADLATSRRARAQGDEGARAVSREQRRRPGRLPGVVASGETPSVGARIAEARA